MKKQCIYLKAERHETGMYLNTCDKLKKDFIGISYCKICKAKEELKNVSA